MKMTLVLAALVAADAASAAAGELTVRISGLKDGTGAVAIALFDSPQAYAEGEEPVRSEFLPVRGTSCEWVLSELPSGDYAIKAYHDLNGNRELDRRKFGIPAEPYGFSNNARAAFGPPTFEAARFELGGEPRTLDIELKGGWRGGQKESSASTRPP